MFTFNRFLSRNLQAILPACKQPPRSEIDPLSAVIGELSSAIFNLLAQLGGAICRSTSAWLWTANPGEASGSEQSCAPASHSPPAAVAEVANRALGLTRRTSSMPNLGARVSETEFQGAANRSVQNRDVDQSVEPTVSPINPLHLRPVASADPLNDASTVLRELELEAAEPAAVDELATTVEGGILSAPEARNADQRVFSLPMRRQFQMAEPIVLPLVSPRYIIGNDESDYEQIQKSDGAYYCLAFCIRKLLQRMQQGEEFRDFLIAHPEFSAKYPTIWDIINPAATVGEVEARANDANYRESWTRILLELRLGATDDDPIVSREFQCLAHGIYTQLVFLPFARRQIEFLNFPSDLSRQNFSQNLLEISAGIHRNKAMLNQVEKIAITLRKLGSKINFMDANRHNLPFYIGDFTYQSLEDSPTVRGYRQLRYATPTRENPFSIDIAPEYLSFVQIAEISQEKILYSNHQSQDVRDEMKRITSLREMQDRHANFYLLSLPVMHSIDDPSIVDEETLTDHLKQLFLDDELSQQHGFEMPSRYSRESLVKHLETWLPFVKVHFIDRFGDTPANRLVFLTILQSLLRQEIARDIGVSYCNNTCKDAIDRGAIHLFFDLYLAAIISDRPVDSEILANIVLATVYPAFGAKKQAILPDRLKLILDFAAMVGEFSEDQLSQLRSQWKRLSNLGGLEFHFADLNKAH